MGYSTMMVQLEIGRSNGGVLGVTRDLAKRMHARVAGVAAAQTIQMVVGDGFYTEEIVREDAAWIEQQGRAAEEEFRKAMGGLDAGLDWDMVMTAYSLSDRVAGPAGLVVAGLVRDDDESMGSSRRVDVEDLIMQTGRPVLAVPPGIDHFDFDCALVAWRTSREARRAVTDALPLLRLMNRVVIAEITDKTGQARARDHLDKMAAWLGRQGVAAIPRAAIAAGDDADGLQALADEEDAELIVAGAYGHTRFREWVLGGVTRRLLRGSGRCLLLAH